MVILDPARKITRARTLLITENPFWGFLALYLIPTPTKLAAGTMATDGKHLFYDPEGAMLEWTDKQLQGAIAHEIGHVMFGHMWRKGARDHVKWNVAGDLAINLILEKNGFELPPGALKDPQWDNMNADAIYAQMPTTTRKVTMDDPDFWKQVCDEASPPGAKKKPGPKDGSRIDGIEKIEVQMPAEMEAEWKDRIAQAASQAKMAGKLPGGMADVIEEILQPKLNWKDLLREYVTSTVKTDFRLHPPNKRFLHYPLYLASLRGESLTIAAAIDTSGSIDNKQLQEFLSEIHGIAEQFEGWRVHLFACDAAVHDYWDLNSEEHDEYDWPREFHGRGGTDFRPVFDKIATMPEVMEDISVLVYLTDTYGPFPDHAPPYPTIWVASTDGAVPFGTVLRLNPK